MYLHHTRKRLYVNNHLPSSKQVLENSSTDPFFFFSYLWNLSSHVKNMRWKIYGNIYYHFFLLVYAHKCRNIWELLICIITCSCIYVVLSRWHPPTLVCCWVNQFLFVEYYIIDYCMLSFQSSIGLQADQLKEGKKDS